MAFIRHTIFINNPDDTENVTVNLVDRLKMTEPTNIELLVLTVSTKHLVRNNNAECVTVRNNMSIKFNLFFF